MHRVRYLILIVGVMVLLTAIAGGRPAVSKRSLSAALPYIGQWSNGRGEILVITSSTIRFASDKAVNYRDITRVTNGQEFHLEITTEGKLNYLTKFIHLSTAEGDKPDEMKMTLYDTRKDLEDGENSQGEATWYRDK